jgi:hypothetical protein
LRFDSLIVSVSHKLFHISRRRWPHSVAGNCMYRQITRSSSAPC